MRTWRYPSDLTDAQSALVVPHIPAAKTGGRPGTTDVRALFDAIIYLLRAGCQLRQLPSDFLPWPIVHGYFRGWRMTGVWVLLHRALYPLVSLNSRLEARTHTCHHGWAVGDGNRTWWRSWIRRAQASETEEAAHLGRYTAFRSPTGSNRLPCRTAELAGGCWPGLRRSGRPFVPSLLMRAMKVASVLGSCCAAGGTCRSSSANSERSRLRVSPELLSAASHGSALTAASRTITSALSRHQKHCCTSLQFA